LPPIGVLTACGFAAATGAAVAAVLAGAIPAASVLSRLSSNM